MGANASRRDVLRCVLCHAPIFVSLDEPLEYGAWDGVSVDVDDVLAPDFGQWDLTR